MREKVTDSSGEGKFVRGTQIGTTNQARLQMAGHVEATDSGRTEEIDPISVHHTNQLDVSVTSETNGTNDRFIDMDGKQKCTIAFNKTAGADSVTMTIQASDRDDGTAPASIPAADWQDITQYGMDIETAAATAASYIAACILSLAPQANYKWIRVRTISAGGANDADYTIRSKEWY